MSGEATATDDVGGALPAAGVGPGAQELEPAMASGGSESATGHERGAGPPDAPSERIASSDETLAGATLRGAEGSRVERSRGLVSDARQQWRRSLYLKQSGYAEARRKFEEAYNNPKTRAALYLECVRAKHKLLFEHTLYKQYPAATDEDVAAAWRDQCARTGPYGDEQLLNAPKFLKEREAFLNRGWEAAFVACAHDKRAPPSSTSEEGSFVRSELDKQHHDREELLAITRRAERRAARSRRLARERGREGRISSNIAVDDLTRQIQTLFFPFLILSCWVRNDDAGGPRCDAHKSVAEWFEGEGAEWAVRIVRSKLQATLEATDVHLGLHRPSVDQIARDTVKNLQAELRRPEPNFLVSLAKGAPVLWRPEHKTQVLQMLRAVPQRGAIEGESGEANALPSLLGLRASILELLRDKAPTARECALASPPLDARTVASMLSGAMLAGETSLAMLRAQEALLMKEYRRAWPAASTGPSRHQLRTLRRSFWLGGILGRGGAPPNSLVEFRIREHRREKIWDLPELEKSCWENDSMCSSYARALQAPGPFEWPLPITCWFSGFAEGADVLGYMRCGPDAPLFSLARSGGIMHIDLGRDAALSRVSRWYAYFGKYFDIAGWTANEKSAWMQGASAAVSDAARSAMNAHALHLVAGADAGAQLMSRADVRAWVKEIVALSNEAKKQFEDIVSSVLLVTKHYGPKPYGPLSASSEATAPVPPSLPLMPGLAHPLSVTSLCASVRLAPSAKPFAPPRFGDQPPAKEEAARLQQWWDGLRGGERKALFPWLRFVGPTTTWEEMSGKNQARLCAINLAQEAWARCTVSCAELIAYEACAHVRSSSLDAAGISLLLDKLMALRADEVHTYARFYRRHVPRLLAEQLTLAKRLPTQVLATWRTPRAPHPPLASGENPCVLAVHRVLRDTTRGDDEKALSWVMRVSVGSFLAALGSARLSHDKGWFESMAHDKGWLESMAQPPADVALKDFLSTVAEHVPKDCVAKFVGSLLCCIGEVRVFLGATTRPIKS